MEPLRRRLGELCPEVELIENLRFHPGEEANDPAFGASLVAGFDYYVNEAFGASHRAHASIMVPPTVLPSAAGPNLAREVATLLALLESPERPFVAVTGGAKVKDKLGIMKVLAAKADLVIVGGGMAYTLRRRRGTYVGSSLFDARYVEECAALLEGGNVLVPVDSRGLPDGLPLARTEVTTRWSTSTRTFPTASAVWTSDRTRSRSSKPPSRAPHDSVERADGCIRGPTFRRGHRGHRSRDREIVAAISVVGGGDSVSALRPVRTGGRHELHLDRRWGVARTGRVRGPARTARAARKYLVALVADAKRPLVIGNWKMNLDFVEGLHLVQQLGVLIKNRPLEHTDVVVAPPFVDLRTVSSVWSPSVSASPSAPST